MKKLTILALMSASMLSMNAYAESIAENNREINADVKAIQKDDAAIDRHEQELEQHRVKKAQAKANKEYGTQAKESVAIGGKKAMIHAKKGERKVDEKILEKDKNDRARRGDYTNDQTMNNNYNNTRYNDGRYRNDNRNWNTMADASQSSLYPKPNRESMKEAPAAKP